MTTIRISTVLRHWMWRVVSAVSGGMTVTGRWSEPAWLLLVVALAVATWVAAKSGTYTAIAWPTSRSPPT